MRTPGLKPRFIYGNYDAALKRRSTGNALVHGLSETEVPQRLKPH